MSSVDIQNRFRHRKSMGDLRFQVPVTEEVEVDEGTLAAIGY